MYAGSARTAEELEMLVHALERSIASLWERVSQLGHHPTIEQMSDREIALHRQRIADEKLDRLSSLVDRLSRIVELTGDFESVNQAMAVDDALTQLERALAPEGPPPTAGSIRRSRVSGADGMNPDSLAEAAEAILFGDADEVADEVSDLNAAEYELAEDRAGWRLGEILMNHRMSPTLQQVELATRVGRRYERAAERDQRVSMPAVCVEKFRHYSKFKRGDWIVGARGGERHKFSSRDRVIVRGEADPRKQGGYVCDETARMVWVMNEDAFVFSKRKQNQSVVVHPRNGTVAMERNEDYRRVVLEEVLRG